jgi:hypothetical protein
VKEEEKGQNPLIKTGVAFLSLSQNVTKKDILTIKTRPPGLFSTKT